MPWTGEAHRLRRAYGELPVVFRRPLSQGPNFVWFSPLDKPFEREQTVFTGFSKQTKAVVVNELQINHTFKGLLVMPGRVFLPRGGTSAKTKGQLTNHATIHAAQGTGVSPLYSCCGAGHSLCCPAYPCGQCENAWLPGPFHSPPVIHPPVPEGYGVSKLVVIRCLCP